MDRYLNTYQEALELNSSNEEKCLKLRKELVETTGNLQEFVKSRSINIMVPLGKKAFVRGTLVHTNELTISHGAEMFSDVSTAQAVEILEHRISNCDERLLAIKKERELYTNKLKLPDDVFASNEGRELIEEYHEEEEKAWRRKHAESVRRQKQIEAAERKKESLNDSDIDKKLEEYEMIEELAGELEDLNIDDNDDEMLSKVLSGSMEVPKSKERIAHNLVSDGKYESSTSEPQNVDHSITNGFYTPTSQSPKYLQEINNNNNDLIMQNNQEIVDLLRSYRCKIKEVLKSVKKDDERNVNLFLDLIELKDDIEDDIRKMNDDEEYSESDERDSDDETTASIELKPPETKRKVRFSTSLEDVKLIESKSELMQNGHNDNNTIQIHFQHSDAKFSSESYIGSEVIAHPGEIYKMFNQPSTPQTARKSILKKNKEVNSPVATEEKPIQKIFHSDFQVIGDVVEHRQESKQLEDVIHILSKDDAPKKVSKFKQMRLKA